MGIIVTAKYYQKKLNDSYSTNVSCGSIPNPSEQDVIIELKDNSIQTNQKYKTYCFCFNSLISNGISYTQSLTLSDGSTPCKEWIMIFIQSSLIELAIIICIPVINAIVGIILSCLTDFERNKTLSSEFASKLYKNFFLQFFNTVLI
jgi:hypothetical protein